MTPHRSQTVHYRRSCL